MHSFLRHHTQWEKIDPNVKIEIEKMVPVREQLEDVERAWSLTQARSKIGDFLHKLRELKGEEFQRKWILNILPV